MFVSHAFPTLGLLGVQWILLNKLIIYYYFVNLCSNLRCATVWRWHIDFYFRIRKWFWDLDQMVHWIILSFMAVENIKGNVTDNKRNIFQIFLIWFERKTKKECRCKVNHSSLITALFYCGTKWLIPDFFKSSFCLWIPFFLSRNVELFISIEKNTAFKRNTESVVEYWT